MAVAVVEGRPHPRAVIRVAQEGAGQDEQVVELQPAGALTLGRGFQGERPHGAAEPLGTGVGHLGADPRQHLPGLLHPGLQFLDVGGERRPPAAAPHVEAGQLLGRLRAQGFEEVDLVGQRREPGQSGRDLVEAETELVGRITAGFGADLVHRSLGRPEQVVDRGRFGPRFRDPLAHQVPVVAEGLGQRPQGVGAHPGGHEELDGPLEGRIGQKLVAEHGPALVEGHLGADLVEHLDARRQARLDRVLGQEPLGEGMEGADGGAVELVESGPAPGTGLPVGVRLGPLLQLAADAVAQLRPGLLGEGDGGDGPELGPARGHEGQDPVDQRGSSSPTRHPPPRTGWCRDRS